MAEVVKCANCGAALSAEAAQSPFVVCGYCNATTHVADGSLVAMKQAEAADGSIPQDAEDRYSWARQRLPKVGAALGARVTWAAFNQAARGTLGVLIESGHAAYKKPLEDVDQVIRIAFNLASDFRAEVGTAVDGAGLVRIAEGSLNALEALREKPEFELNLPFLCANSSGPKHLQRTLDAATLSALAAREPVDAAPAAAPHAAPTAASPAAPASAPAPEPKSFWRKLFG